MQGKRKQNLEGFGGDKCHLPMDPWPTFYLTFLSLISAHFPYFFLFWLRVRRGKRVKRVSIFYLESNLLSATKKNKTDQSLVWKLGKLGNQKFQGEVKDHASKLLS